MIKTAPPQYNSQDGSCYACDGFYKLSLANKLTQCKIVMVLNSLSRMEKQYESYAKKRVVHNFIVPFPAVCLRSGGSASTGF